MEHGIHNEETIDLKGCIEFARRRKYTIIVTILLFLGAGYFFAASAPLTYTISTFISEPPGESLMQMRNRVNRRLYDEDIVRILEQLSARADFTHQSSLLIESPDVPPDSIGEKVELLAALTNKLILYYEDKIEPEKERVENLIREIEENGEKITAHQKYSMIAHLKLTATRITNIEVIKEPHAKKNQAPKMSLSLSMSGIAGLYFGVVFGIIKDLISRKKESENAKSQT